MFSLQAKGLMIYVLVKSTCGKFDILTATLAIGSGVALLAVAKLTTDMIMQYALPNGR